MAATKPKRMTKGQIVADISEKTDLTKKQVVAVFDALRECAKRQLGPRGPGEFVIPEVAVKLKVRKVPAQKAKQFRNPATGEVIVRDVPASKKLRATPLKKLKEMVL